VFSINNHDADDDDDSNTNDSVYGVVVRVDPAFVWWIQSPALAGSQLMDQASRLKPQIRSLPAAVSAFIIATYCYYSARNWYSSYRPTEGRRLSWPGWLVTYWHGLRAHPSSNPAWHGVISLIETNMFTIHQGGNFSAVQDVYKGWPGRLCTIVLWNQRYFTDTSWHFQLY